ncbi:hypothetical protein V6B33_11175 [Mangrovibacillus sp. Mu-81]|uniref:hypothetical protein n=1 Tax=Mangrovibacillus sp. Mu-81 TaxID=3121478 RepID=UPI002FE49B33
MEGVDKMERFAILMVPAQDIHDPDVAVTVRELKNGGYEAESNLEVKQYDACPVTAAFSAYIFSKEEYKKKRPNGD